MGSGTEQSAHKDVVLQFAKAVSANDRAGISDVLHPEATWTAMVINDYSDGIQCYGEGGNVFDREGTLDMLTQFQQMLVTPPGFTVEILSMVAEGDTVAVEARGDCTSSAGRRYHNRYSYHLEFKDGLIFRGREYQDTLHTWDVWMRS